MTRGDEGRPWWASGQSLGEDARGQDGDPPPGPDGQDQLRDHPHGPAGTCQVCPLCSFLRVLGEVRPEVTEHLLEASRHLTLAAKAVVDAHADGFSPRDRFERIRLDDD